VYEIKGGPESCTGKRFRTYEAAYLYATDNALPFSVTNNWEIVVASNRPRNRPRLERKRAGWSSVELELPDDLRARLRLRALELGITVPMLIRRILVVGVGTIG